MRANNCLATSTNMSRVLETVIGIVLHILIKTVRKVLKKIVSTKYIKKLAINLFCKKISLPLHSQSRNDSNYIAEWSSGSSLGS